MSKDRAGEGENHFNGISEGKMLATVGLLQASWEAQAESWRQVTAQPQEPVGFVSCLYISLGILYEILVSGLNLDPIDNLSFFVEKSRFNQTSTPTSHPHHEDHSSTWPWANIDHTQAKSRTQTGQKALTSYLSGKEHGVPYK